MNKLEIRQKAMALKRYQPYLAMIFIQILYAGMALFSKASISNGMNPYVFVVYRQAFATLALAPFAIFLESNKTTSLSFSLLVKIFFISLLGITLSLDLCYVSISYISATFAAAGTNMIPVITFILAICFRMESICYKQSHGIAKIIGSVVCVAGALIYAFVNGPPLYPESHKQVHYLTSNGTSKGEWIKGSLIMLLANTMWSLWLILQGPIMKQYPAKIRLTTLQCLFSCIQSAIWAISVKRDIAAWKLGCVGRWALILAKSLGDRDKRTSFYSYVYSIIFNSNSRLFIYLLERNSSFGKCMWSNIASDGTLWCFVG
ncbi:WAT1-related protein At1g43650 isoform X2 [Nicotiana tomentosiformis]|uniref:WAT1-related protein n=1 Tax=Nicotiana tabacum TaxID=4097 RepID=A0A1S4CKW3_TOBAC|nr:PREDICTED: WAT1-related protein At1g43650-like isoform X2 [Nicotiana tabacum]XP_033512710.1 WAT1-related protein At1g43650 isoform X2 [Nicotiana tomentosiformis]